VVADFGRETGVAYEVLVQFQNNSLFSANTAQIVRENETPTYVTINSSPGVVSSFANSGMRP
jgi:hypothetical protein